VSVKDMPRRDRALPLIRLVEQGQDRLLRHDRSARRPRCTKCSTAATVQTAQVCFNLLNPSAAHALPRIFPRRTSAGCSTTRAKSRIG